MDDRHAKLLKTLVDTIGGTEAHLAVSVRQGLLEGKPSSGVLGAFCIKVQQNASNITDENVASLLRAGYSDDQIFEAIVSVAIGAGLERVRKIRDLLGIQS
jgi:hypothetical protein